MPLAEALAVAPGLRVRAHDPGADRNALGALAEWLLRYGPIVGLEDGPAPDSVLLDVSGCAGCFGGEGNLLRRAARELAREGWTARVALADTVGAAWALAHAARAPALAPPGEAERVLAPLPVTALRLPAEAAAALAGLGVDTIGRLAALDRATLPARFGDELVRRLDQAFGRLSEVFAPHRPVPPAYSAFAFEYPVERLALLLGVIEKLTEEVVGILQRRFRGARRLECWLYPEGAEPVRVEVALCRPTASAGHLGALLRTRLERVTVPGPVSGVSLRVMAAEPIPEGQPEFFEGDGPHAPEELAALIDRLSSRLGPEAVTRVRLVPDPQPEYACRFEPVMKGQGPGVRGQRSETRGRGSGARGKRVAGALREDLGHAARPRLWREDDGERSDPPDPRPLSPRNGGRGEPLWPLSVKKRGAGSSSFPDPRPLAPGPCLKRPVRLWLEPVRIEVVSAVPDGPPVRFWWAGVEYWVTHARGPERIETGWWRGNDVHRDYYAVATHAGGHFWIFRRRDDGRWFLHGCFD